VGLASSLAFPGNREVACGVSEIVGLRAGGRLAGDGRASVGRAGEAAGEKGAFIPCCCEDTLLGRLTRDAHMERKKLRCVKRKGARGACACSCVGETDGCCCSSAFTRGAAGGGAKAELWS